MNAQHRLFDRGPLRSTTVPLLSLLLLTPLALLVGIYLGRQAVLSGLREDPEALPGLQARAAQLAEELGSAKADLVVQTRRHEVDRRALEMVRREMAAHKEETAGLEEDLRFYRGLMAPGDGAGGLSLRKPQLVAGTAPRRFSYRIVVQQEARKHEMVHGTLSIELFGVNGEEELSYPLAELSQAVEEGGVPLQFRYFQAIEGELTLPDGLEARGLSIVLTASKPQKTEVREQFPWELQEAIYPCWGLRKPGPECPVARP